MALADELERIAAAQDEPVSGVLAAELIDGSRIYLCAYVSGAWLGFDEAGKPVQSRRLIREAVSLSALCEVAEDVAGDDLPEVQPPPRLATNAYLDSLGAALGPERAGAIQSAAAAIEELANEVERGYKLPLS